LVPISVELELNTAPIHVVPNHTTNESIEFAPTNTTRSPFPTPLALNAAATLPARFLNSPKVAVLLFPPGPLPVPPSRTSVTATRASSLSGVVSRAPVVGLREKSRFSAKLRLTPSNQRGTASMGRDSSTARE
jgi:hypothetical protein